MSDGRPLRMGTRASLLARTQSGHVAAALTKATGRAVEEVLVRTEGDQLSTEGRIPSAGDSVGVFVRALDDALRRDEIDFAVHSLKDVPTEYAEDLLMAAVPARADVRDALVVASRHAARTVQELPRAARVATASPRRVAQLLRIRPDLVAVTMAGNVDTRLRRLEEGRADALILACAGLDRLSFGERITLRIPLDELLSAPAQGALGISCRRDDAGTAAALATLDDPFTSAAAAAERSLLHALRAGCRAPVAALATAGEGGTLVLRARVLALDGSEMLEDEASGPLSDPIGLGRVVAERLLVLGAQRLVTEARAAAK
ncbi:MAG: hydroxymethylbilane synthase [Holophagales bacterium]|nr:hydroxymethylbilane synthase [Holophagales bacterium]